MEVLQMDPSYGDRDLNVGFPAARRKGRDSAVTYVEAFTGHSG